MMFKILVVCTANICRSPAGELLLANALKSRNVKVESAGTRGVDNHFAHPVIQEILFNKGIPEIGEHRSTALMPSRLHQYGLILCMDKDHVNWIQTAQPTALGKTRLYGHWSDQQEVVDPINGPRVGYVQAVDLIERYSGQWAQKIIDLGLDQ